MSIMQDYFDHEREPDAGESPAVVNAGAPNCPWCGGAVLFDGMVFVEEGGYDGKNYESEGEAQTFRCRRKECGRRFVEWEAMDGPFCADEDCGHLEESHSNVCLIEDCDCQEFKPEPVLASTQDTEEVCGQVMRAAAVKFPGLRVVPVFEHGHWWVQVYGFHGDEELEEGGYTTFDVVDAAPGVDVGDVMIELDFEEVG